MGHVVATCNVLGACWPRLLYAADPVQGSTCHSVWGVLRLRSRLPSMHKPAQRPDVPEEHQGRLRGPVAMPSKPTYSPQPRRGRYLTLLPISGSPDMDRGTCTPSPLPASLWLARSSLWLASYFHDRNYESNANQRPVDR